MEMKWFLKTISDFCFFYGLQRGSKNKMPNDSTVHVNFRIDLRKKPWGITQSKVVIEQLS